MSFSRTIAWAGWLIVSIFYAYQYILRVMPSIMLNDIMNQFKIDSLIFGQFSGSYYLGYCLMHLPIGISLDRYGARKVMTLCILITVLGLMPIIFAENWFYGIVGRFLIGAGSSAAILGAFKIIRMTFAEKKFTIMLSLSVTIGLLGAIYGGAPVSYFCDLYGYKIVVKILALIGLILAFISYLLIPATETIHKTGILSDLKIVLTNQKFLLICFLAGAMVGPMEGFADAWGSAFLQELYSFSRQNSNYLISMIYLGMCFAPLLSTVAEKTNSYLLTIALSGLVMFLAFILLILGKFTYQTMAIGFFLVGISCAYQILAIYKASKCLPEEISGLTTALANMIIMSFGYLFHSIIGLIIKIFAEKGQALAFLYGIGFIPLMLLIGIIGFILIAHKERAS